MPATVMPSQSNDDRSRIRDLRMIFKAIKVTNSRTRGAAAAAATAAKSLQSCPTLGDPMDCSLPGSSIHGVFHARVLWSGLPLPSPSHSPTPCPNI